MSDPFRRVSSRRLVPFPGQPRTKLWSNRTCRPAGVCIDMGGLTPEYVKSYLTCQRSVLDEFVMESVSEEDLLEWLNAKKAAAATPSSSSPKPNDSCLSKFPTQESVADDMMMQQQQLTHQLTYKEGWMNQMNELTRLISSGIKARGCVLFGVRAAGTELYEYAPLSDPIYSASVSGPIEFRSTIGAHVAKTMTAVMVKDVKADVRFPKGTGMEGVNAHSVLCVPVVFPTGELFCVMEFTRGLGDPVFTAKEKQTAVAMATWSGCALHQSSVNASMTKHCFLNDFLLDVTKNLFANIVAVDVLVEDIMTYTKELVQADRCSLFTVDMKERELYAEILDEGDVVDGKPVYCRNKTVRFSLDKGIAGEVATTGELINIKNAYYDCRFNSDIDAQTGYVTKNILCMPIISKGDVIGVVQMINKLNGDVFTSTDETSFKTFAVYCALALRYSKVYQDAQKKTAQYQVALELVSFHLKCGDDSLEKLLDKPVPCEEEIPPDFLSYDYYGPLDHCRMLPQLIIYAILDIVGPRSFEVEKLCEFVLTLRKSYRPVPYHNFEHGFNVFHSMYCMLKRLHKQHESVFTELRMKALLISTLSHDVDHRGLNNTFLVKQGDPLASLYGTSTMEFHHYDQTIYMLQQEGCDIFSNLSSVEYKQVLEYIRRDILATDLATYFPNQKIISQWLSAGTLDLNDEKHFGCVTQLMMTAADLCASCKRWDVQCEIVRTIYEEFHRQGDVEKERGFTPIPMMDRDHVDKLPKDQVGFIKHVCMPCYTTLSTIFPETTPLVQGLSQNLEIWEEIVEGAEPSQPNET